MAEQNDAAPPAAAWDPAFKKWLFRRYFRDVLCAPAGNEEHGYQKMLLAIYRGRWIGRGEARHLVTWAASADEVLSIAFAEWQATQSSPSH